MILDLGCGTNKVRGAIGVDIEKNSHADVIHDLSKFPYPFENGKFKKIHAKGVLEHLPNTVKAMEELYRLLKPNGKLIIRVPHFSGSGAWANPTHIKPFAIGFHQYFMPGTVDNDQATVRHSGTNCFLSPGTYHSIQAAINNDNRCTDLFHIFCLQYK